MSERDEKLDELTKRVRGLGGPDREVDADVFQLMGGDEWDEARRLASRPSGCPPDTAIAGARKYAPLYTASLDAVVALIERELPERNYIFARGRVTPDEPLYGAQIIYGGAMGGTVMGEGEHNERAIALLLACLTAIKVQPASAPATTR